MFCFVWIVLYKGSHELTYFNDVHSGGVKAAVIICMVNSLL